MRIGIIDDDVNFLSLFKEKYYPLLVEVSLEDENELICSTEMISPTVLNQCDLVFFDIQLEDKNSIEMISASQTSFDTKIVFLSQKNSLVFDALRVRPLTFIRKNNLNEDFEFFLKIYKKIS